MCIKPYKKASCPDAVYVEKDLPLYCRVPAVKKFICAIQRLSVPCHNDHVVSVVSGVTCQIHQRAWTSVCYDSTVAALSGGNLCEVSLALVCMLIGY